MGFDGETPTDCALRCSASEACHGFVTFNQVCYFRGGAEESVEHMVENKVEAEGVTLYVLTPMLTVSDVLTGVHHCRRRPRLRLPHRAVQGRRQGKGSRSPR